MDKNKSFHRDQKGLVAIVITMIVILILSLIVLTFARMARREQRQTLDRQLNTLAFYAAESGVNDAAEFLKDPSNLVPKTDCDLPGDWPGSNVLDGPGGVISYTCVLIDPFPDMLEFNNVNHGSAQLIPIERETRTDLGSISIHWQSSGDDTDITGCPNAANAGNFSQEWPANCSPGMLQIDMMPFSYQSAGNDNLSGFNRGDLINGAFTVFAVPNATGTAGSVSYSQAIGFGGANGQGRIVSSGCSIPTGFNNPRQCQMNITGISNHIAYLRITPIYKSASIAICSPSCASRESLRGAQVIVDATGKANDVLRRIRVSLSLSDLGAGIPNSGIETSHTLCKQLMIIPPSTVRIADPSIEACRISP
jgi:hypothetical protein